MQLKVKVDEWYREEDGMAYYVVDRRACHDGLELILMLEDGFRFGSVYRNDQHFLSKHTLVESVEQVAITNSSLSNEPPITQLKSTKDCKPLVEQNRDEYTVMLLGASLKQFSRKVGWED